MWYKNLITVTLLTFGIPAVGEKWYFWIIWQLKKKHFLIKNVTGKKA
jgi:hypothetical protein